MDNKFGVDLSEDLSCHQRLATCLKRHYGEANLAEKETRAMITMKKLWLSIHLVVMISNFHLIFITKFPQKLLEIKWTIKTEQQQKKLQCAGKLLLQDWRHNNHVYVIDLRIIAEILYLLVKKLK